MKWETLINFPSEQSIKAPPSCSDSHCGSKGRNYIVKNSSCPGWQRPPGKMTCDWHSVWGGEPGLADRARKAKGQSEISSLTTATQTPDCHSRGICDPGVILTYQSEQLTQFTEPSDLHPRFRKSPACHILAQIQRKRKTHWALCVCVCVWKGQGRRWVQVYENFFTLKAKQEMCIQLHLSSWQLNSKTCLLSDFNLR